jgi:Gram-negative bacterial TonB protein C-terminal
MIRGSNRHAAFAALLFLASYLCLTQEVPEGHRKVVNRVIPTYPSLARTMKLVGSVRVEAVVAPDGIVKKVEIIRRPSWLSTGRARCGSEVEMGTGLHGEPRINRGQIQSAIRLTLLQSPKSSGVHDQSPYCCEGLPRGPGWLTIASWNAGARRVGSDGSLTMWRSSFHQQTRPQLRRGSFRQYLSALESHSHWTTRAEEGLPDTLHVQSI